jgi:pyruvate dehydrogenase E1 component alpha subunit
MPGIRVENNSVEGVYAAAGAAVQRARSGGGPTLIEVHTLRLWGHFEGDAQGYRPELAEVPSRDPIPAYEAELRAAGVLDEQEISRIRTAAADRVEQAIQFAKSSPRPDPADARKYAFAAAN